MISELMTRLRELIVDAFNDDRFGMLMFAKAEESGYAGLPGTWAFDKKVFETIKWAYQYGQAPHVLWLAQIVFAERPKRKDIEALVKELDALVNPSAAAPAASLAAPNGIPDDLAASLSLLEGGQFTMKDLRTEVRSKLRSAAYPRNRIADYCHLSDSVGRRLLAVLALEAEPDPAYVWWLSERVSVEMPFVGFTAAQGLTTAAMRLSTADLKRVSAASNAAVDRLNALVELDTARGADGNVAARKRQLDLTVSIGELRSRTGSSLMSPGEADAFISALLTRFDRDSLGQLCRNRLSTELKWLANLDDPWETIVASVILTAREKNWEKDLIRAVYAEKNTEAAFTVVYEKYAKEVN